MTGHLNVLPPHFAITVQLPTAFAVITPLLTVAIFSLFELHVILPLLFNSSNVKVPFCVYEITDFSSLYVTP